MSKVDVSTPEGKQAWIEALRSGDYKKGTGHLCENDTYCCLGVLADLNDDLVDGVFVKRLKTSKSSVGFGNKELFGLKVKHHDDLMDLYDDNDTFEEVIKYIEANV